MTIPRPLARRMLAAAVLIALPALAAAQEVPPVEPALEPALADQAPTESAQAPSSGDATTLDTIVVTGSATGGVKKLEASYNIVTANEEQIKQANPKSTADLLKISPGMWPESTGGQTGANIEIAGFPAAATRPTSLPC